MRNLPTRIVPAVMAQHVDDAVMLRNARTFLVRAPHVALGQLLHFDKRLLAHLDGIVTAGPDADPYCDDVLTAPSRGVGFVLATKAIENRERDRFEQMFALAEAIPDVGRGLRSAFGWVSAGRLHGVVARLLDADVAFRRSVGLAALSMHGEERGALSNRRLTDADCAVRARAYRTVGEAGFVEALDACISGIHETDASCSLWAARSAVLLGDRGIGLEALRSFSAVPGPLRLLAFDTVIQASTPAEAHEFL